MRVQIGQSSIEILQGDISEQDTEAIVNAANDHLWMGSGVAGAIKRKGGDDIEREAMEKGPVEVGSAVVTSAGKLKAKYVIHAVAMGQDLRTDSDKIIRATRSTLRHLIKNQIRSISFPAIGTGVGGFSRFHCAKIMLTEVIEFLINEDYKCDVKFVLFDQETYDAFNEELKLQFSTKRHPPAG